MSNTPPRLKKYINKTVNKLPRHIRCGGKINYLIIGLGNPGEEYANTRHNIGRRAVLFLAKKNEIELLEEKKLFGEIGETKINKSKIAALLPETFMNNSGKSVGATQKYYKIKPENIMVIHDDSDIEFGRFKISFGKRSAGHKGVQSVIRALKTKDFWRVRIGIRPAPARLNCSGGKEKKRTPAEKLVLQKFNPKEETLLKKIISQIISEIEKRFDNSK